MWGGIDQSPFFLFFNTLRSTGVGGGGIAPLCATLAKLVVSWTGKQTQLGVCSKFQIVRLPVEPALSAGISVETLVSMPQTRLPPV